MDLKKKEIGKIIGFSRSICSV